MRCGGLDFTRRDQLDIQRDRYLVADKIADDARVVILDHFLAIDGNAAPAALRAATLS